MAEQITRKSVIKLSSQKAKAFFLSEDSYFTLGLPPYFTFTSLLKGVAKAIKGKNVSGMIAKPREYEGVNYTIFANKDGKYAWRPHQLIHPVLYVALVNTLTERNNWIFLKQKFKDFAANKNIKCLSLPVTSLSDSSDKSEQVMQWWQEVEQKSITLALDYEYLITTDITDCYPSIYTHSVAWSLHSKAVAKQRRNDKTLLGNQIDSFIQDMSHGQTNGLPQGSVLMDFIAEMILGYADIELGDKIASENISNYKILRYRDDYRIFVNNLQDGEKIVKMLTEVMLELGLKLNPIKTRASNDVIRASIKEDKLAWLAREKLARSFQKRLLIIHDHATQYPNSGSVIVALLIFYKHIIKIEKQLNDTMQLISIVVDIAFKNPRSYEIAAAIISKLLSIIEKDNTKISIIKKIKKKFSLIPNTGYIQIWLQRVSIPFTSTIHFDEALCNLASGNVHDIWNNAFISDQMLKNIIDPKKIIDTNIIDNLNPVILKDEIEMFFNY